MLRAAFRWREAAVALLAATASGVLLVFGWHVWFIRPFPGSEGLGHLTQCSRYGVGEPAASHTTWRAVTDDVSAGLWVFLPQSDITSAFVLDSGNHLRDSSGRTLFSTEDVASPVVAGRFTVSGIRGHEGTRRLADIDPSMASQLDIAPVTQVYSLPSSRLDSGTLVVCGISADEDAQLSRRLAAHVQLVVPLTPRRPHWFVMVESPAGGVPLAATVCVALLGWLWPAHRGAVVDSRRWAIHRLQGASRKDLSALSVTTLLPWLLVAHLCVVGGLWWWSESTGVLTRDPQPVGWAAIVGVAGVLAPVACHAATALLVGSREAGRR